MKKFILSFFLCISQLLFSGEIKEYNEGTLKIEFEGEAIKKVIQVGELPLEYRRTSQNRGILTVDLDYKRVSEVFWKEIEKPFVADSQIYIKFDGKRVVFQEDGKTTVYYKNGKIKSERY